MQQLEPRTFRRLRLSDAKALEQLCREDQRWNPHFYKHQKWLERALGTIGSEGRVVFGGFSDTHDGYRSIQRLDSAIFLKVSDLNNSAELKNLVLRNEEKGQTLSEAGRRASIYLIEKAIRFCEMRDIAKLEIELPESEHGFISIFLQKGFRILSQRERYFAGQSVYSLEKLIGETYYGDPFNREQLGSWLLHALLPCRVGKWENFGDKDEVLSYLSFEISPAHPAFSESNSIGFNRRLRGGLFILDESRCVPPYFERLEQLILLTKNHVNYLMADKLPSGNRQKLERRGFVCFDREEVRAIAGGDNSSLRIPMEQSDVAGVLTVLEEPLVKRYASFGPYFVYFLLGGIGDSLVIAPVEDGKSETGVMLAVHCPKWEMGQPSIVAIAEVVDKVECDIRVAHDHFPREIPRALSKDELEFYATRADQRESVISLLCSKLKILPKPFTFSDQIWAEHREMYEYLVSELEHANTAYLNEGVCEVLWELSSSSDYAATVKHMPTQRLADVVVIVIREDEQRAILQRLPRATPLIKERGSYMIADVPASMAGVVYRVAVVRAQEQGQSEAQFAAQNAIEDLHPQWLAVVGIAGAVPDTEFGLGDVVLASRVHDFSISAAVEDAGGHRRTEYANQGGPMMRVIGKVINLLPSIVNAASNWSDTNSISAPRPPIDVTEDSFYGSDAWKRQLLSSLSRKRASPIVTSRAVASSGALIKDTVTLQGFRDHSRDVAHVEMEVAGVYHAANTAERVYPVLAVRGISDVVGLKRHPDWTIYACNTAAAFFLSLLQAMPEGLLEGRPSTQLSDTAGV